MNHAVSVTKAVTVIKAESVMWFWVKVIFNAQIMNIDTFEITTILPAIPDACQY